MLILQKQKLSGSDYLLQIEAPHIAKHCQPGQYVTLYPDEKHAVNYLISYCDNKSITIVFSKHQRQAKYLSNLRKGMKLHAIIGPLGRPIPLDHYGNVCVVCDSEGLGPGLFLATALKQFDNRITMVIGYEKEDDIFWKDRVEDIANKFVISVGRQGTVDPFINDFHNIIRRKHMNLILSLSDLERMEEVSKLTKLRTHNLSFLTPLSCDGVGMNGVCRLKVGDEQKAVCQDGPGLDGNTLDWPSTSAKYRAVGRQR